MNTKLKELMIEAGYAAPEIALRAQKLAELVVRECIKVGEDYSEDFYHFKDEILKHFGVEE